MKTLVINTGSSSIKFALFSMPQGYELASGLVEQIGEESGAISMHINGKKYSNQLEIKDHKQGLMLVADWLMNPTFQLIKEVNEVQSIGHRVVHGGETFQKTTIITDAVKKEIEVLAGLAPLHNPANLQGIVVAEKVFPNATQVAVFDTAFHSTLPPRAYRYALPNYLYADYGIRVYGFHGTSHRYVTKATAKHLQIPVEEANFITIHLGNGASMAAVKNGKSIDTSLGLTPITGLVMGTRVGDLDPGVIFYLEEEKGYSITKVKNILNKESGMKGLAGDNDLRNVCEMAEKGHEDAQLALDIYTYRIKKYIGAYLAAIGPIQAIIFTAGVGENSAIVREMVCTDMAHLGIKINSQKNGARESGIRAVQADDSTVKIMVTPTNEELEIANQTFGLLEN